MHSVSARVRHLAIKKKEELDLWWSRLMTFIEDSPQNIAEVHLSFRIMLDQLHADDFFGTEGQNDPRGDSRS